MAFAYLDEGMIKKLLISMIRSRLEYTAVVWSPHTKRNIIKLGNNRYHKEHPN